MGRTSWSGDSGLGMTSVARSSPGCWWVYVLMGEQLDNSWKLEHVHSIQPLILYLCLQPSNTSLDTQKKTFKYRLYNKEKVEKRVTQQRHK